MACGSAAARRKNLKYGRPYVGSTLAVQHKNGEIIIQDYLLTYTHARARLTFTFVSCCEPFFHVCKPQRVYLLLYYDNVLFLILKIGIRLTSQVNNQFQVMLTFTPAAYQHLEQHSIHFYDYFHYSSRVSVSCVSAFRRCKCVPV